MKDADRLRRAIDQLVYLPSLRQGSSAGPSLALAAVDAAAAVARERKQGRKRGGGSAAAGCGLATSVPPPPPPPRPWDREGLFRRAATFKPSTWFDKDAETAGPLRAAARGWTNVGVDLLRCEFCGEKLAATAATTATGGGGGAGEEHENNEKTSFPSRLVSCHAAECPWRTGPACDLESLAQFPPLTREAAEAGFSAREAAALALDALPPLSRASYDVPARAAPGRLEALLQLGPRPEGEENEDEEAEAEDAPEPPVLLLAEAGDGSSSKASPAAAVARHGSELHRRMARLVALFGWSAEIVAPGLAKRALEELAAAEQRRMKAAVEEATARGRGRRDQGGSGGGSGGGGGGGGGDAAASETGNGGELLLLWPPKPLPSRPPASAMPAGTVRACDAALRCEACGATAGLWSFVPSELCGNGSGGRSEEEGGGAGAAAADSSTPPAAKQARRAENPSPLSGWSTSPPGKAAATAAAVAAPSRPRELDLISLHRSWCPFVDPLDHRRRRVGWRWTLAALVPAVPGDDEAGEGDARLLRLEEDEEEKEAGAKRDAVGASANADTPASSPPTSSERATDRLRAVLARAGIIAPGVKPPSRSLVN